MTESSLKAQTSKSVYESSTKEGESKFIKNRRCNTKSDLIEITEDKLENILLKHLEKMLLRSAWIAPASILATLITVKTTATFNNSLGIDAAVWEALTIFVGGLSFLWLLKVVCKAVYNYKSLTLSSLLIEIKDTQSK